MRRPDSAYYNPAPRQQSPPPAVSKATPYYHNNAQTPPNSIPGAVIRNPRRGPQAPPITTKPACFYLYYVALRPDSAYDYNAPVSTSTPPGLSPPDNLFLSPPQSAELTRHNAAAKRRLLQDPPQLAETHATLLQQRCAPALMRHNAAPRLRISPSPPQSYATVRRIFQTPHTTKKARLRIMAKRASHALLP